MLLRRKEFPCNMLCRYLQHRRYLYNGRNSHAHSLRIQESRSGYQYLRPLPFHVYFPKSWYLMHNELQNRQLNIISNILHFLYQVSPGKNPHQYMSPDQSDHQFRTTPKGWLFVALKFFPYWNVQILQDYSLLKA